MFDTWVGELTLEQYREFALPATQLLIEEIGAGDTPVILYTKASSHLLAAGAESGANVLSVDWRVDLATVREQVGMGVALQGNVDLTRDLGFVKSSIDVKQYADLSLIEEAVKRPK